VIDQEWRLAAACRGVDTNLFFNERGDSTGMITAMEVCNGTSETPACPVREECLKFAMSFEDDNHGIFGGLTPSARLKLRRGQRKAEQLRKEQERGQHHEVVIPVLHDQPDPGPMMEGRRMYRSGVPLRSELPDKPLPTDYEWRLGLRQLVRLIHEAVLEDMNQDRARKGVGPIAIQVRP
jgi:WhiB family redox-sensing transcriptional regulator